MAWFKEDENGQSIPMVTIERVHRALGTLGFEMDSTENPNKLVAGFNGYVTTVDLSNPTFLIVRSWYPMDFPPESMSRLMDKANEWNAEHPWGTAVVWLHESGESVSLHSEISYLVDRGLNDEQLVSVVDLSLQCCVFCLKSFHSKREGASGEDDGPASAEE